MPISHDAAAIAAASLTQGFVLAMRDRPGEFSVPDVADIFHDFMRAIHDGPQTAENVPPPIE